MSVILSNNIPLPEKRERFKWAVLEGMEKLPDSWQASISEPQKTGTYVEVTIEVTCNLCMDSPFHRSQ